MAAELARMTNVAGHRTSPSRCLLSLPREKSDNRHDICQASNDGCQKLKEMAAVIIDKLKASILRRACTNCYKCERYLGHLNVIGEK